jgi:hypothetical protein
MKTISIAAALPFHTNHTSAHKDTVMTHFRTLALLALLVLAPAGAFAATALNINITCTITASNAIEWTNADGNANVTGQREWTITGATVNTAYLSVSQGTLTGPAGGTPAIATQATALNFTNRGNITITSSVTVANGTNWNFGGAPATDVFMAEASVDGGANYLGTKLSGAGLQLSATQAKDANCDLALRFTTPTSLSTGAKVTSAQVVTILATQN